MKLIKTNISIYSYIYINKIPEQNLVPNISVNISMALRYDIIFDIMWFDDLVSIDVRNTILHSLPKTISFRIPPYRYNAFY